MKLLAPVSKPDKVLCVGMNYKEHCDELKIPRRIQPIIFSKFASTIIGPFDNIVRPTCSEVSFIEMSRFPARLKHSINRCHTLNGINHRHSIGKWNLSLSSGKKPNKFNWKMHSIMFWGTWLDRIWRLGTWWRRISTAGNICWVGGIEAPRRGLFTILFWGGYFYTRDSFSSTIDPSFP